MKKAGFRAMVFMAGLVTLNAPAARAQKFTLLYKFTGGTDGGGAEGPLLVQGGAVYGTTTNGGSATFPSGYGTVFEVDIASREETVLHAFAGGASDGEAPYGGVISDAAGNLYGATAGGGSLGCNCGTVFELSPAGAVSLLYSFASGDAGSVPEAGLTAGPGGVFYGTTYSGGYGGGTVFELAPAGNLVTLHKFKPDHGRGPDTNLLLLRGALYGTTVVGGRSRRGTIFRVNPKTGRSEAIYNFTGGVDGATPIGGLLADDNENLYGTASAGGMKVKGSPKGAGVVFLLNPATRQETIVHTFAGGDGRAPSGRLAMDSRGNLYGTTQGGGEHNQGTIYEIDSSGSFAVLYSFGVGTGRNPASGLTMGSDGKLYGTTVSGGDPSCDCGTVFQFEP